jgi:small subunit ribosomal protein S4
MGDPKKKHKKYSRPKQLFDKTKIEEERNITKKFGLKNKKEIWRAESEINRIRGLAKKLIVASPEEQEKFFNRLINLGLIKQGATIDDVLALTREKLLERRLQTIVAKKGLSKTVKEARQLIVHRKVRVAKKVIDAPSYHVKADEEDKIKIIKKEKKKKKEEKTLEENKENA